MAPPGTDERDSRPVGHESLAAAAASTSAAAVAASFTSSSSAAATTANAAAAVGSSSAGASFGSITRTPYIPVPPLAAAPPITTPFAAIAAPGEPNMPRSRRKCCDRAPGRQPAAASPAAPATVAFVHSRGGHTASVVSAAAAAADATTAAATAAAGRRPVHLNAGGVGSSGRQGASAAATAPAAPAT